MAEDFDDEHDEVKCGSERDAMDNDRQRVRQK
jgi:hypothetical protein